jgi:uncharacterized protein (TIGR02145 family)/uncharacterized repeat protein (TIGR02543 family)
MKKRTVFVLVSTISLVIALFQLHCLNLESPNAPEKTKISAVFKASSSKIYETSLIDSVGKEIWFGAALYLPVNFDSLQMSLVDNGTTVFDSIFRTFKDEYYYDTIWVKHTFLSPGIKNLTITPFSTPERAAFTTTITIQEALQNASPKWSVDTLRKTTRIGTPLLLSLSEMCTDTEKELITFTLVPGAPDNDTIINTVYQFNPTLKMVGTHVAQIRASDQAGNYSILPIKISVDTTTEDKTAAYSVTYQKGTGVTGNIPVDSKKYQNGEQIIVSGNTGNLVKSGFTFSGWNTKEDGSGALYAGGSNFLMGSADVVLFAQWTSKPTFTVTYNGNSNTAGTVPVDSGNYQTGTMVTVKGNTGNMVKVGCAFAGWNTASDGSGTAYAEGTAFSMGSANTSLYAQWKPQSTFTVTYNGNAHTAGAEPVDPGKYEIGTTITVKDNTGNMVKAGCTFAGWNSVPDGSGSAYAAGSTFTIQYDVTLYARWTTKPTFTVTYNGNGNTGGAVPSDANKYEPGVPVTVKENTGLLTKTGATFAGWNTTADGSGITYVVGATFLMGSTNVILYAQWTTKPTFTVLYNGNGNTSGTVPADANKYEPGATVTVKENTGVLAKTGSKFTGWNTTADGSGTAYAAGAAFLIGSANVTLYAQWTLIPTFKVTYIGNGNTGGSVPVDTNGYASGSTVLIKSNVDVTNGTPVVKTGYTFGGWNINSTGSGKTYRGDGTDTLNMPSVSVTLYAKWVIDTCTVTFISTGTTVFQTQKIAYNGQATLPATQPVLAGNTFDGWFTTNDASGVAFDFSLPITANRTLYAKWTPVYSVIYQANGGTGAVPIDSKKYKSGESVTVLDNTGGLAKTDNDFAGWTLNAQGTGTVYNAGDKITIGSSDVNVYAKWMCTVSFNSQSATIAPSPATKKINTSTAIGTLPTDPQKTSYIFDGWYTNLSDQSTKVSVATIFNRNATVYAKWVIKDADGNVYTEVKIGNQVWMVENLKTTRFNAGAIIPLITDSVAWWYSTASAYCWYDNDPTKKNPYGALYNWYAVNSGILAPKGWHVPNNAEWNQLIVFAGGEDVAGSHLKDTILWGMPDVGKEDNVTGFSALPGGGRYYEGLDESKGFLGQPGGFGLWWSSNAYNDTSAYECNMALYNRSAYLSESFKKIYGCSVRCIRDY